MESGKPTVIFTTFWDAQAIKKNGAIAHVEDGQVYKIDIEQDATLKSIAISNPMGMRRIDCLCPSWSILKQYKLDNDWDVYTKEYQKILMQRKLEIAKYIDSLTPDAVYILCCWENTCHGANCHRRILFDTLSYSGRTKDIANYVYRHGDKGQAKKEAQLLKSLSKVEDSSSGDLFVSYNVGNRTLRFPISQYARTNNSAFFLIPNDVSPVPASQPVYLHSDEIVQIVIDNFGRSVCPSTGQPMMACSATIISENVPSSIFGVIEEDPFEDLDDDDDLFDVLLDDEFGF